MSGLTGYTTSNGIDLSSVFLINGGGTFTGTITTSGGIVGPPTSITYDSNMIGYRNKIFGDITNASITSGSATLTSLITNGFTLPIGVYFINAFVINSYTYSTGSPYISSLNIYLSTSSSSSSGGFNIRVISSTAVNSSSGSISGNASNVLKNGTSQTYYLLEGAVFVNFAMSSNASNSYIEYIRIS
jgi:hypothetical protein